MINPVVGYKLDPGEFGVPFSASASNSGIRVIGHELGNLNRFRMEAIKEGGTLVSAKISLTTQLEGPFVAAVQGETEVTISHPVDKNDISLKTTNPSLENVENKENKKKPEESLKAPSLDENNQEDGNKKLVDKLETADKVLTAKLNALKLQEMQLMGDDSPSSEAKKQELEKARKELETKLKYVEKSITNLSINSPANKTVNLNNAQNTSIDNFSYTNGQTDMFLKGLSLNLLV
ncbi:MAG: hypothetical protein WC614_11585 [bacterium]